MKRRLLLLLLLSTFALSQTTPNLLLNKPPLGAASIQGRRLDDYRKRHRNLSCFSVNFIFPKKAACRPLFAFSLTV
jgi:hypothetical protein